MNSTIDTHLCGSIYDKNNSCPYLVYATNPGMKHGRKELKLYYAYCTINGRCRSLGCAASFTGNSPKWCPKRIELEKRGDDK